MKFGLFYEHQLPKPYDNEQWDPDQEHKLLKNALDQIELADQLGQYGKRQLPLRVVSLRPRHHRAFHLAR